MMSDVRRSSVTLQADHPFLLVDVVSGRWRAGLGREHAGDACLVVALEGRGFLQVKWTLQANGAGLVSNVAVPVSQTPCRSGTAVGPAHLVGRLRAPAGTVINRAAATPIENVSQRGTSEQPSIRIVGGV